jgi:amino acid transporter
MHLHPDRSIHRRRGKTLGVPELIAIALGGMVGGGIFTILGVSVAMIGVLTPAAILLGGLLALFAAYSYIKLGVYYKDEGATYSFYKKTFPRSPFAASLIGWWVIFGYVSTLALYAYTFSSYAISGLSVAHDPWVRKLVAIAVIGAFTLVNVWSVKGMGRIEDLMVYTKLVILVVISFVLMDHAHATRAELWRETGPVSAGSVLIVSSVTFVAYEGFQLVINAVEEMDDPDRSIPRAIYSAIAMAVFIYVVIAIGAIVAIPFTDIVANKEYALAAGSSRILGHWGSDMVVLGALLATSSAISGTVFGSSRQMSVIAADGYFPEYLAKRRDRIPVAAILTMSAFAVGLIVVGDLEIILEFGSVTFLLVSLLMAYANFRIRRQTGSSTVVTAVAIGGLGVGTTLILYYEATTQVMQILFIGGLYALLTLAAWLYAKRGRPKVAHEGASGASTPPGPSGGAHP